MLEAKVKELANAEGGIAVEVSSLWAHLIDVEGQCLALQDKLVSLQIAFSTARARESNELAWESTTTTASTIQRMEKKITQSEAEAATAGVRLDALIAEKDIDSMQAGDLRCIVEFYDMALSKLSKVAQEAQAQDDELEKKLSDHKQQYDDIELPTPTNFATDREANLEKLLEELGMKDIIARLSIKVSQVRHCTSNVYQYVLYIKALRKKAFERLIELEKLETKGDTQD